MLCTALLGGGLFQAAPYLTPGWMVRSFRQRHNYLPVGRPATIIELGVARAFQAADSPGNPDVIFAGDSTCWGDIDPGLFTRLTGLRCLNMGCYGGIGPTARCALLRKCLDHCHGRPLVVECLSADAASWFTDPAAIRYASQCHGRLTAGNNLRCLAECVLGITYRSYLFSSDLPEAKKLEEYGYRYWTDERDKEVSDPITLPSRMQLKDDLADLATMASVVVWSPIPRERPIVNKPQFQRAARELELPTAVPQYPADCFANLCHLNRRGVVRFTTQLAAELTPTLRKRGHH